MSRRALFAAAFALALFSHAPAQSASRRIEPPQWKVFFADEKSENFQGTPVALKRGLFQIRPAAILEDVPGRRRLLQIEVSVRPEEAFQKPTSGGGGTFGGRKTLIKPYGKTEIELIAVETREAGKTLSLASAPDTSRFFRAAGTLVLAIDAAIAKWSDVEILFHIRIVTRDEQGREQPLPREGRRTVRWKPDAFTLELLAKMEPQRPLRPAFFKPRGSGLAITPERPLVGETFTAVVILHNIGELASETQTLSWRYGAATRNDLLPPVAPNRTITLSFAGAALLQTTPLALDVGASHWDVAVEPRTLPDIEIRSIRYEENFLEDPLKLIFALANIGSAAAESATLILSADGQEATFALPAIAAGAVVPWTGEAVLNISESALVRATVYRDDEIDAERHLAVRRRPRPRPLLAFDRLEFSGSPLAGHPCRLTAVLRNDGDAGAAVEPFLVVEHEASGRRLAVESSPRLIPPGESVAVRTAFFPAEGGLLRGSVACESFAEFILFDVRPFRATAEVGEMMLAPAPREAAAGLSPLPKSRAFAFAPMPGIEEMDSVVELILPLVTWPENPIDPRPSPSVASVRVKLKGKNLGDNFTVPSTDTVIFCEIPSAALAETLVVTLERETERRVYLVETPVILVGLSARENGALLKAVATDTGLWVVLENRAQLIRATTVTVGTSYGDEPPAEHIFALETGAARPFFIPARPPRPGHHFVTARLTRSPAADPVTLPQFRMPEPAPRFILPPVVIARRSSRPETGLLIRLGVRDGDAIDARLHLIEPSIRGNRIADLPDIPAGETFVLFLPGESRVRLDYGPVQETRIAPRARPPDAQVRILPLEREPAPPDTVYFVRFVRFSNERALPAARVFLVANGFIRTAVHVPAVERGKRYFAGLGFRPTREGPLEILLFEDPEPPADTTARVPAASIDIATVIFADTTEPTRSTWNWTRPVLFDPRESDVFSSVYLRLAERAYRATAALAERLPLEMIPISPQAARDLDRLAGDTSITGRVDYREKLQQVVREWEGALLMLAGSGLPVTLESADILAFRERLDRLEEMAGRPAALDRAAVERELEKLSDLVEILLGIRVRKEYL